MLGDSEVHLRVVLALAPILHCRRERLGMIFLLVYSSIDSRLQMRLESTGDIIWATPPTPVFRNVKKVKILTLHTAEVPHVELDPRILLTSLLQLFC